MEKQRYLADLEKLGKNESTTGSISGYRYAIFRTDLGNLCGYVEMTGSRSDVETIECHGGVTYDYDSDKHLFGLSGHFIGFDCAHASDWVPGIGFGTYKDVDFVMEEIKKIIDQLEVCNGRNQKNH